MEKKKRSPIGVAGLKGFSKAEKRCNRCGFVTFYLRVLYAHKYKCRGKLLGSLCCCYCKRKFNFLPSYYQHKKTCVKHYWKKKFLLKKKLETKLHKIIEKDSKHLDTDTKSCAIACPTCMTFFSSRQQYNDHAKKGNCSPKITTKKGHFSARKSLSKPQNTKHREHKKVEEIDALQFDDDDDSYLSNSYFERTPTEKISSFDGKVSKNVGYICMWCKNVYPSKTILLKHLEKNAQCAAAHNRQTTYNSPSTISFTARKSMHSVVARKSFPHSNHFNPSSPSGSRNAKGSARKTLPNSHYKSFNKNEAPQYVQSPRNHLNQSSKESFNTCPVCYENFYDPFTFFQHQKKAGHWGRATKSSNANCKCPFCKKEFFSVRARNAHVCNHADKSPEEIENFLKCTTCNLCSQVFVSEMIKQQHVKIAHAKMRFISNSVGGESSKTYSFTKSENRNKHSLLPVVMKQKLKEYPNSCPICSKEFSSTHFRNKHFQEKHLDSELECKFCPLKFNSIDNLEYHMQEFHYESFKFECLVCNINLATAPHVVLHVTKVHADQNPKNIIGCRVNEYVPSNHQTVDTNYTSSNFDKPSSVIQGRSTEFYCDICGMAFQKLCGLTSHRQSKLHRDTLVKNLDEMHASLSNLPPSPPPVPKKTVPQPEILTCSECSEEFTNIKDFVPHRLSHFGVKSKYMKINELNIYTCEICGEVSDSHSKVQMHLFWHLQVESTSNGRNSGKDRQKNDPIVPDRLSGQHVAKKSFSKQSSELQQEVVIGGVKKSLFTCEACKIGFTTQSHYSLHVRKFCKMKSTPTKIVSSEEPEEANKNNSNSTTQEIDSSQDIHMNNKGTEIIHCPKCNCLFFPSVVEVHEEFCKKCVQCNVELDTEADILKSDLELQSVVAICITCNTSFDNPQNFSQHMLTNHKLLPQNEEEVDADENIYCITCNCLFFSSDALENHEIVCSNFSYSEFDASSNKDILRAASELDDVIAVCITCCLAFNSDEKLNDHIAVHKNRLSLGSNHKDHPSISLNESKKFDEDGIMKLNTPASPNTNTNSFAKISLANLSQGSETEYNLATAERLSSAEKSLNLPNSLPVISDSSKMEYVSISSVPVISDNNEEDPIDKLRENFSQLLCILINDPDLMHQLGYGEQPVDDVLTNVLQQMGQVPILKDDEISELDCLRKNIQILLDFCLKDQIMELIGNGKTSTDDIVIEALKMFSNDDSVPMLTVE